MHNTNVDLSATHPVLKALLLRQLAFYAATSAWNLFIRLSLGGVDVTYSNVQKALQELVVEKLAATKGDYDPPVFEATRPGLRAAGSGDDPTEVAEVVWSLEVAGISNSVPTGTLAEAQ